MYVCQLTNNKPFKINCVAEIIDAFIIHTSTFKIRSICSKTYLQVKKFTGLKQLYKEDKWRELHYL